MTQIETSILHTVIYADIFDYPLTEAEIWRYWIGKPVKFVRFREALAQLRKKGLIREKEGYYVLKQRISVIKLRQQRAQFAGKKMLVAKKAAGILKLIPFVWFIGISGALSMQNSPKEDDIDFFIISSPRKLWITRLLSTILLDFFALRRKPGETRYADKICLNMFMDESAMSLPKKERDLYSAHEVAQLKPIVNKFETYDRFLSANKWVQNYLPHAVKKNNYRKKKISSDGQNSFSVMEKISKSIQLSYMSKKRTKEVINRDLLRFHPIDARERVMKNYQESFKKLKV